MKVGTIVKLKVDCLGNKAGTLGVVFYDYGNGFQAIFENGNYDGFSRIPNLSALGVPGGKGVVEAAYFLEEVGFEESLAGYQFKNVIQVSNDFDLDIFSLVWSEKWKKPVEVAEPERYEKCRVSVDGKSPAWLRFARGNRYCMLTAALDFPDFAHFEYADIGPSIFPRRIDGDIALYPQFVVFCK